MPVYDADSMNITAAGVDRIAEDFRAARDRLRGHEGENPFGEVEDRDDPEQAADAIGSFASGMRAEFDAATHLMTAASSALRDAVRAMSEADAVAADNLTLREV
ncbi:hypothetical protein B0I33_10558 [Prauserella shujinwangii]|uniref:Uncharacterized protein n=1 Tax=Prauserella shujinwangii TaxID=1453103 RepID=A0A2T0LUF9_9PSEU|nr:hypothetical protein [Prauserella shujinwangii]PRX47480.1 hypothetical protein B0I33_10558 [Prauserella shujinwangii]